MPCLAEFATDGNHGRNRFKSDGIILYFHLGKVLHPQTVVSVIVAKGLRSQTRMRHQKATHPVLRRCGQEYPPQFVLGRDTLVYQCGNLVSVPYLYLSCQLDLVVGKPGSERFQGGWQMAAADRRLGLHDPPNRDGHASDGDNGAALLLRANG